RHPPVAKPPAVPSIPASARGVSTHRSGPKRSRSPAVARNTPPARPTSSPMTMTLSSRSISTRRASFTASTSVLFGIGVPRDEARVGLGHRLGSGDPGADRLLRLRGDRLQEVVSQQAQAAEVALVAANAVVRALGLHALRIDVAARVVSRPVRRTAVRDRFDEGRAVARPGA